MNKAVLTVALTAVGFSAFAKPEISWSIMHPTPIDVDYMHRVVAKAVEYGDVDSFEVCGNCHGYYSGVNGLSMLEKYPNANAHIDKAKVEKIRKEMREICQIAHAAKKPLYYWHREICIPEGLLKDLPNLLDENGEFDLLGPAYQNFLRYKIDDTFKHCPELDGIVLTLTEADYSVIHNSRPDKYPPQKVVEQLVGIFAEEHEKRGKRFILRSFGSNSQDYIDIIGGAVAAARKHGFEVETKVTEADFVPWLPINPFLKKNPPLTLGAECDALGEYLSAGYLPAAQVQRIGEYVQSCRECGVDRYAIRIDRVGNSIFDTAHEVNLYAYHRFIKDPAITADQIIREYSAKHFGDAKAEMVQLIKGELEMIRNIHYVASNLVFHTFPIAPNFKYVKAGGIFSIYREGASLAGTKDLWAILTSQGHTPTHAQILAEKEKGLAMAEYGRDRVLAMRERMPKAEFERQYRAFSAAVGAAKSLQALAKCFVAYFEDMEKGLDFPTNLVAAVDSAVKTIEPLMTDPTQHFQTTGHFSELGNLKEIRSNIDMIYFYGPRYLCRELLNEYRAERKLRKALLARREVIDFVVPGGIYDDNRTIRTMHGALCSLKGTRLSRYAGNNVFPNGTITVKFSDVVGAKVEVKLDPAGAKEYSLTEKRENGNLFVTIGKKGAKYPGIVSIALVSPRAK